MKPKIKSRYVGNHASHTVENSAEVIESQREKVDSILKAGTQGDKYVVKYTWTYEPEIDKFGVAVDKGGDDLTHKTFDTREDMVAWWMEFHTTEFHDVSREEAEKNVDRIIEKFTEASKHAPVS